MPSHTGTSHEEELAHDLVSGGVLVGSMGTVQKALERLPVTLQDALSHAIGTLRWRSSGPDHVRLVSREGSCQLTFWNGPFGRTTIIDTIAYRESLRRTGRFSKLIASLAHTAVAGQLPQLLHIQSVTSSAIRHWADKHRDQWSASVFDRSQLYRVLPGIMRPGALKMHLMPLSDPEQPREWLCAPDGAAALKVAMGNAQARMERILNSL